MHCLRCGFDFHDSQAYCPNCGTPNTCYPQEKQFGMVFHHIFSIFLIFSGMSITSCFSVIRALLQSELSGLAFFAIFPLAISAVELATGILLLLKHKIGYIMSVILNITMILTGLACLSLGIAVTIFGNWTSHDVEFLFYIFGFIGIVGGLIVAIWHTCAFFYYKKRKSLFIN